MTRTCYLEPQIISVAGSHPAMLIAVDTNILMDLAAEVESVVDALQLVRRRIADARLIVVPTVIR